MNMQRDMHTFPHRKKSEHFLPEGTVKSAHLAL